MRNFSKKGDIFSLTGDTLSITHDTKKPCIFNVFSEFVGNARLLKICRQRESNPHSVAGTGI